MDDLAKRLRETTYMYQADCELKMKCAARIEQLAATCEELEAKLLSATMDGYDMAKHEYRDRIDELEAKLAECEARLEKAVEALQQLVIEYDEVDLAYNEPKSMTAAYGVALDTLAELSSVSCANLKGQNDE